MDASNFAIGGYYLYQLVSNDNELVIAYGDRKLPKAELMYPTREKELLAALYAMELWKVDLIEKPFFDNTEHPSCSMAKYPGFIKPMFRWIPGESNILADSISRNQASSISLQDLLLQLADRKDVLDEEVDSLFAL
ncbi:hypothetical protein LEN26_006046 [Aphanomyces euteiches]|nr:hypothetical protein AeMF1_011908 [Aphanomyces euteiches]KAH9136691.1 hypothetical protein LEN26_006046 [Aphanomyces euteiches]